MYNRIIQGDLSKAMALINDSSVTLNITDLPYGTTAAKWDKLVDMEDFWSQSNRVANEKCTVALFAAQPFTSNVIDSNEKEFRYVWYWLKNQGTNFFHAKRMPIRKVEEICIFKKGNYFPQMSHGHPPTRAAVGSSNGKAYHGENKRNTKGGKTSRYPTNILDFKCVDNYSRKHSAQKPVKLYEYLIKTYTKEFDTVIDCCAGSGTVIEACINTNRRYIAIDNDPQSIEMCVNRANKVSGGNCRGSVIYV